MWPFKRKARPEKSTVESRAEIDKRNRDISDRLFMSNKTRVHYTTEETQFAVGVVSVERGFITDDDHCITFEPGPNGDVVITLKSGTIVVPRKNITYLGWGRKKEYFEEAGFFYNNDDWNWYSKNLYYGDEQRLHGAIYA